MKEKIQPDEMERAAQIISAVGNDSQHGLTLNPESRYYFADNVRGVIPYTLAGGKKGALRRNVAKLNRAGIVSMEYCPENAVCCTERRTK